MITIKQGTARTVYIGPFLDSTDGVTPETGLSPTIYLSKDGAARVARNSAGAISHDASGFYRVPLNTTDTGTTGSLRVMAEESGALPVWEDFLVVEANAYDSLVSGTDSLEVDTILMKNADSVVTVYMQAASALTVYDPPTKAELDSGLAALPTAAQIRTEIDSNSTQLTAIVADTNELQTDWADGGRLDLIIDAAATASALATVDGIVDAILVDTGTTLPASIAALPAATDIVSGGAINTTGGAVDTVTTVTNQVTADVTAISGDSTAADNMESWFDNTGYNASNSSVGVSVDENSIASAVAAALAGASLTFITPLSSDGQTMEVAVGDAYMNTDERAFDWTSAGWADLTGATVEWRAWHREHKRERYGVTMSVVTAGGGTQKVRLELPTSVTSQLSPSKRDYAFAVVATLASGNVATLVADDCYVEVHQTA